MTPYNNTPMTARIYDWLEDLKCPTTETHHNKCSECRRLFVSSATRDKCYVCHLNWHELSDEDQEAAHELVHRFNAHDETSSEVYVTKQLADIRAYEEEAFARLSSLLTDTFRRDVVRCAEKIVSYSDTFRLYVNNGGPSTTLLFNGGAVHLPEEEGGDITVKLSGERVNESLNTPGMWGNFTIQEEGRNDYEVSLKLSKEGTEDLYNALTHLVRIIDKFDAQVAEIVDADPGLPDKCLPGYPFINESFGCCGRG